MSCPYSDEQLDYWDGVSNPMGKACYECEEWDCEHNPNSCSIFYEPPEYDPPEQKSKVLHF